MIKQLMNNLIPAAKMAAKPPIAPQVNHFASAATRATSNPTPVMNAHHQLAADLKSGAVKFTPNKPALPHTATKGWSV